MSGPNFIVSITRMLLRVTKNQGKTEPWLRDRLREFGLHLDTITYEALTDEQAEKLGVLFGTGGQFWRNARDIYLSRKQKEPNGGNS